MYAVFLIGHRRQLKTLPWDEAERAAAAAKVFARPLGWPFEALGPDRPFLRVTNVAVLTVTALAGWLAVCIGHSLETLNGYDANNRWLTCEVVTLIGGSAALGRVLVYCNTCRSPISLFGRIATGRLIIPGYDRVMLAPLAILLTALAVAFIGDAYELLPSVIAGLAAGLVTLIGLGAGPSLRRWHLTGEHRIVSPLKQNTAIRPRNHTKVITLVASQ
jgi:hypothetical protein